MKQASAHKVRMMNVVYIHTHDSGRYFSPYGANVPTVNLEKFAADACVFTNAYCTSPTCSPSRCAMLSGKYPHNNGMMGLGNRGFAMNDYKEHLVHLFNSHDYLTVLCGVQHEAGRYVEHEKGSKIIGYQLDISTENTGMSEKELVEWDRANTDRCVEWLGSEQAKQPFFLSMGYFSTHREYPTPSSDEAVEVPAYLMDCAAVREDLKGHVETLRRFDTNFGKLIEGLKANGLYENTIIMFTTDHGLPYPLAKCTLYDAGIGVALILRVPNKPHGIRCDSLVSQVDVYPTLCSLLGIKAEHEVDGVDFSVLLENPSQTVRQAIFAEVNFHTSYEPIRCIRTERYKYIRYYDETWQKPNLSNIDNSISKQAYMEKRVEHKEMKQLYDLKHDPYERHNLIDEPRVQEIRKKLEAELAAWQVKYHDPLVHGAIELCEPWVVNTNECIDPKSKNSCDFITR